jgi:CubicO group peptidase (beta-lactamase class C family)
MHEVLRIAMAGILLCISSAASYADPADDWARGSMARTHGPGVALAVIHNGTIAKAGVYGFANIEWQRPVTRDTVFWQDSLTKLFTAVGVMQLADQGKLSLDDPITKYLTDAPPA